MKSRIKQVFSLILALTLVLNVVPGLAVPAAAAETAGGTGSVVLSKTATLEADGTYTIDLSGFVTGQTTTTQYATNVPLDVILVLDASSSMLQFRNTPDTYMHTATIAGWPEETTLYNRKTTSSTNLWDANLNKVSGETDLSRASWFYSYDAKKFIATTTSSPIRGSLMVPVKPGDKIYCSSFQSKETTGGAQDGICVAYFDKDGKLLKLSAPSSGNNLTRLGSFSAAEVYAEFTGNNNQYITVPDGAYIMNVPVWNADKDMIIYNLSLGEQRYRPENYNEFQAMGSKILQKQVEKFTEDLAENAKLTGQDHKLAIVTYGGGDSKASETSDDEQILGTKVPHQGYYEKYVGVNGWSQYYFTNTGLFVDGTFKNYLSDSAIKSSVKHDWAYHPVYDTADAPLDKSETYYYMTWGQDTYINDKGVAVGGGMIAVNYYTAEEAEAKGFTRGEGWYDADNNHRWPRESPYDKFGRSLFYTRNEYKAIADNMLTDDDYKKALTNILVDGEINPDIKYATDRYVSRGTTHTKYGLAMALHILKQNPVRSSTDIYGQAHQGKQIVILFTDGETDDAEGDKYSKIFELSYKIKKQGATLYTVSVGDEANPKWLDQISSNYSDNDTYNRDLELSEGSYCINVDDISELEGSFASISSEIVTSNTTVELGESAVMQDYLADGLTMPEDFGFGNIKVFTMGIQTDDEITYTTTNKDGNFVLVPNSISQNGDVYTATYNYTYAPDQTYSKDLYVSYNKVTGCVSVTGFDYALNFVSKDHPGRKLMVTISGIEATKDTKTDQPLPTNTRQSGIAYEGTLIPFDVPVTQLNSKNYVADYAKPMVLDPSEWGVKDILGIVSADRLKLGEGAEDLIQTDYGTFQKNADGTVTFTPSTMQWDGEAVVYVLGSWEQKPEGISTGDRVWTRVSVVPANNIYYEDDFQGVVYDGNWSVEGTLQTGTLENPIGAAGTTNPVHGWEQSLVDAAHSDGAAHMGTAVAATEGIERQIAEVSFTFKGAGVDIYGFTSEETGTVLAMLTGKYEDENGVVRSIKIVDTVSVSGDYYQIPTLSFMEYKGKPLPFGTYTVKIGVTTAAKDRCTYYLDGIRVYNPMENDSVYADAEKNAKFVSVRDLLAATDDVGSSAVFVDKTEAGDVGAAKNYAESDYGLYGPKNEVYLAAGQSITFKVDPVGAYYYVGLKCPDGSADGKVKFSNGNVKVQSTDINHSTDLYYAVVPDENGYITIANSGEALLSVTKLRIAGPAASGQVLTISEEEALGAVQLFSMRSVEEDVTDPDDSGSDNTGSSNTENNTKPPVADPDYNPVVVPEVDIRQASLSFEDEILVNMYYIVSDITNVKEHGILVFNTNPGTAAFDKADAVYEGSVADNMFIATTDGIAAKKMGDDRYYCAYSQLENGEYVYSRVVQYSPKKYAFNMLGRASTSAKLKVLCVAMLNYGTAAQEYFGYRTDDLMNAGLTDEQKALVIPFDAALFNGVQPVDGNKVGAFASTNSGFSNKKTATVSFEGAFAINYYFPTTAVVEGDVKLYVWTPEVYAAAAGLTEANASAVVTMEVQDNGSYWGQVQGIAAKSLDKTYYVAAVYTDAAGNTHCTGVIAYSLSKYCLNNANGKMGALAQATAMYGYYAAAYFV